MHPQVLSTNKLETHFFDNKVDESNFTTAEQRCEVLRHYVQSYFLENYNRLRTMHPGKRIYAFEKTPSYIRTPGVAAKVHALFGDDIKIIAILRNPIDRMYSHYSMQHSSNRPLANTFDDLVRNNLDDLRRNNLTTAPLLDEYVYNASSFNDTAAAFAQPLTMDERLSIILRNNANSITTYNSIYTGMYAVQLREWLDLFAGRIKVYQFEQFQSDTVGVFDDILNFLSIPAFEEMNETVFTQRFDPLVVLGRSRQQQVPADSVSNRTREYLQHFFKPYNDELADLLGEEWRGLWE